MSSDATSRVNDSAHTMVTRGLHCPTYALRVESGNVEQVLRSMEADECVSTHTPAFGAHVCSVDTHPLRHVIVCMIVSASRCRAMRNASALSLVNAAPRPVHHWLAVPTRSTSQPRSSAGAFLFIGYAPLLQKASGTIGGAFLSLLLGFPIEANNAYYVNSAPENAIGLLNVLPPFQGCVILTHHD